MQLSGIVGSVSASPTTTKCATYPWARSACAILTNSSVFFSGSRRPTLRIRGTFAGNRESCATSPDGRELKAARSMVLGMTRILSSAQPLVISSLVLNAEGAITAAISGSPPCCNSGRAQADRKRAFQRKRGSVCRTLQRPLGTLVYRRRLRRPIPAEAVPVAAPCRARRKRPGV